MENGKNFRELKVWQEGMALAKDVYLATGKFPDSERYGLISQMRRAAVSIPSNIAEGQGRYTPGDFAHFVTIASGSLAELETQIELSFDLGFLTSLQTDPMMERIRRIRKMLSSLHRYLRPDRFELRETSPDDNHWC